jgi:hypothetical protein
MDTQTNRLPLFLLLAGLLVVVLVLAYFVFQNNAQTAEPAPAGTPSPIPTATARPAADETPTASPSRLDPTAEIALLDDDDLQNHMLDLLSPNIGINQGARSTLFNSSDPRVIPVAIEMLRATQLRMVRGQMEYYGLALNRLTGEEFGLDWAAWVEWYGASDIEAPPGFTEWKGRLLSIIDPGFGEFLYAGAPSRIRVEEIQWGGVLVDGIPALDNSPMISPSAADYLAPQDAVFGLEINGDARAYPLRIMDWHEMANDVVGGVPVSIAYCTLCGAAVAYDGRATNGETYDFGSSGFLFRSNKLMYDRQTRTLWNQLTGRPVLGPLVEEDVQLTVLPIVLTTWEEWLAQHPNTQVLDSDTGFARPYETGAAYADYFAAEGTMFPVWQRADLLETKDQIYALNIGGVPKAYPIDVLAVERVVNDELANVPVVLVSAAENVEQVSDYRGDRLRYSAGSEIRAYERGEHTFSLGETADTLVDENGDTWQIAEDALVGPNNEILPRLGGHLAYWFGWFAFYPQTLIYGTTP